MILGRRKCGGFTLIEVLVALVVFAIMSGLAYGTEILEEEI